ncbi:MAG TPA: NAD-dependent epimerase/dehydratase family protein [Gammaproteobacteria bacterium]|nr:NAD-dependent epimerase/dehydratase family protein [Gammaproteobacteria bacterium]
MSVLVTGADGFVGKYVCQAVDGLELIDEAGAIDIRERTRIRDFLADRLPEQVIHLAAQSHVPASFEDPETTFAINFHGTFNLLSALQECGFRGRFLYISSGDIYGRVTEDQLPITEEMPARPRNPYAVSKVAAEALCYQFSQTGGFECVIARPFNHIGAGQSDHFAVSDFSRQIVSIKRHAKPLVLKAGDVDVTRDFLDVRDVVSAYLLILEKGINGECYNVCSGRETRIRDIITLISQECGLEMSIEQDLSRFRPSEQRRMCGDNSRLVKQTGWKQKYSLQESVASVVEYWEKQDND